jgi:hypothetical protein
MAYLLFSLGVIAVIVITAILNMPVKIEAELD